MIDKSDHNKSILKTYGLTKRPTHYKLINIENSINMFGENLPINKTI